MRKLAALALLSLVLAADADACTCVPVDLDRDLPRADGAMIGTVLERRFTATKTILRFRVEQIYKGDLDSRIDVESERGGAACGLELDVGQRTGLLLERAGDTWRSSLCSQVEPSDLLALTNVEDNTIPPVNIGGIVAGVLVLGLGAFFLVRKARSYRRFR
ncbi:MAG: hypothetical protein HOQ03_13865 [Thermoleophilia bacterium]|nr:hypothetical protein [Thermoleophilia bacterium]